MVSPRRRASSSCGKLRRALAVIHFAVQLEPVDAARHFDAEGPGAAEDLALGFDVPARLHQPRTMRGSLLGVMDPLRLASSVGRFLILAAQFAQQPRGGAFRLGIAPHEAAASARRIPGMGSWSATWRPS